MSPRQDGGGSGARSESPRAPGPLPLIGWREWVAVPDLGIARIKAKADTGARTSALHAVAVRVEGDRVRFRVHPMQREAGPTVECEAPLLGQRSVRSSTGEITLRPVILTRLVIGDRAWDVEVTLVRRDLMGFRMLLGRQAVRRRLRVDPGRSFLAADPTLPAPEPVAARRKTRAKTAKANGTKVTTKAETTRPKKKSGRRKRSSPGEGSRRDEGSEP